MVSIAQLQEVPPKNLILLVGPPGAGKSTFCQQAVLQNVAMDRPTIFVTTECGPSDVERALKERGLPKVKLSLLNFVDVYNETVGLSSSDRPNTSRAVCEDLSGIGIAISKLSDRIGRKGVLLIFDSLTSPYLFSGSEVLRFMRRTLSSFAASGNAVLACMDEGCGKEEDLGAMMSMANGIIKIEVEDGSRVLNVVKHPLVEPTRIEVPTDKIWEKKLFDQKYWDKEMMRRFSEAWGSEAPIRREVGDYVNVFWPNFARWSSILWDPKRFPEMRYEMWVKYWAYMREIIPLLPWHTRLMLKLFMPKNFSKVKDMKKPLKFVNQEFMKKRRYGIMEYIDNVSKSGEHYIRVYESSECCGLKNLGAAMASVIPSVLAGVCKGLEKEEREWNAVETKCLGLGDPYCEFKVVPGEIPELKASLEKEASVVERIHERLMNRLMGFLLEEKPLVERPKLGSGFLMGPEFFWPATARERYRMALRMGGARAGKEVGEHLMDAGIGEDEASKRVLHLLDHCKVGKVSMDETIRMRESCESWQTKLFKANWEEPMCFFTTGFLNGFFSAVKNQHVKETKCIAMGDPYCEWKFA